MPLKSSESEAVQPAGGESHPVRVGLLSAWTSRLGGGVFEAVAKHAEMIRELGMEPVIVGLADEHSPADRSRFRDAELYALPVAGPAVVGYAPAMARVLEEARLDILHLHGIWMYPSAAAAQWARRTGRPYVISPHGMLDPWIVSRGKLKKAVARTLYERGSWARASCFHALTASEAEDVQQATGRSECIVIPNAVTGVAGPDQRKPILAYLGRIHPKKNLDGLIHGWRDARDVLAPAGAALRIAGWGEEAHVEALRADIAAAGGSDIEFLGPLYGAEKSDFLGSARFLSLASHSEGLPVAIIEAWAAGTPTIMSRHCHLPQGYESGAAIDCGTEASDIAAALRNAFSLSPKGWEDMSRAALRLANGVFSPDSVARRWQDAYSALLAGRGVA